MTVNTERYLEFVNGVTSQQSKDHETFVYRVQELEVRDFLPAILFHCSVGMCVKIGEFTEVVKKIVFQGKPVTEEICSISNVSWVTLCGMFFQGCGT